MQLLAVVEGEVPSMGANAEDVADIFFEIVEAAEDRTWYWPPNQDNFNRTLNRAAEIFASNDPETVIHVA